MENNKKKWFVPKSFGRGFTPITRQGRVCVLILIAILMGSAYSHNLFDQMGPSPQQYVGFLVDVFVITLSSSRFMEKYTDGELKRRRGKGKQQPPS